MSSAVTDSKEVAVGEAEVHTDLSTDQVWKNFPLMTWTLLSHFHFPSFSSQNSWNYCSSSSICLLEDEYMYCKLFKYRLLGYEWCKIVKKFCLRCLFNPTYQSFPSWCSSAMLFARWSMSLPKYRLLVLSFNYTNTLFCTVQTYFHSLFYTFISANPLQHLVRLNQSDISLPMGLRRKGR